MWIVGKVLTKSGISIRDDKANYRGDFNIDMCWANGMIGVCPVFQDEKSARIHGGPDAVLIEMQAEPINGNENINIIGEG